MKSKLPVAVEPESIENIPGGPLVYQIGNEYNDYSELCGKTLPKEKKVAECSLPKDYLGTPATLIEETSAGAGHVIEDSSPHDTKAASKDSKKIHGEETISQEHALPRRRRRRRSKGTGIVLAPDRRHSQSSRNGAKHKKKPRHRHKPHSNVARSRIRKRTTDVGIFLSLKTRKEAKTMSGRKTRHKVRKLADNGVRHRPRRSKLHGESGNNEISCVHVIVICTKALVDFFRGYATGW